MMFSRTKNFVFLTIKNTEPLMEEVNRNEKLFGSMPLRTSYPQSAHKEVVDILLRGPVITDESTLEQLQNDVLCFNYRNMEVFPKVYDMCLDIMTAVKGEALGRVVITKLPPGGKITPHRDEGEAADLYDRFHLVLQAGRGSFFIVEEEFQEMITGDLFWINNHKEHSVANHSDEDRIHLIVDVLKWPYAK